MKIIVTGATGMVGAEVVRQAILDKDISEITCIVRKPMELNHPKIKTILHQNFLDYSGLEDVFKNNDACLWCLGISQTQVTKEQYVVITYDYTIAAANAMVKTNPNLTFMFLSGQGADNSEQSKTIFARIKGKTENALLKLPFKKLFNVRPAGIKPIHKNPNTALANKIMIPLFPIFEIITPSFVIASDVLAKVMLHITKNGYNKTTIENKELKEIYKSGINRHLS